MLMLLLFLTLVAEDSKMENVLNVLNSGMKMLMVFVHLFLIYAELLTTLMVNA